MLGGRWPGTGTARCRTAAPPPHAAPSPAKYLYTNYKYFPIFMVTIAPCAALLTYYLLHTIPIFCSLPQRAINNKVCIEVMQLFLTSDHGSREGQIFASETTMPM